VNILKSQRSKIVTIIIAIFCITLMAGCKTASVATASRAGVEPFFKSEEGLALKGYDAVTYFTESKPEEGRSEFEAEWNGAKWHFASAQNRELFLREPAKYAPQYGGYCSWAVGHGYTAKGDPEAWKVVEGKLYLNYNQDVKAKWEQEMSALISKGNENWISFQKTRPEHKGEGTN
jgi:YHS domain-containing protein